MQFDPKTRFLVTGGAGFIGSNLCEAILNKGCFVRCLDDFSTGKDRNIETFKRNPHFELMIGDIRDLNICIQACEGADFVLHHAAWGSVPRSIEMPLLYEDINVKGTLNMLEAAKLCGVKKFVYASSSAVYGDSAVLPNIEGAEGKLLSPYAFTKHANEEYAALYTALYGLDTYGLRYFNVFGRRQDPDGPYAAVVPKFISSLLNDTAPVIYGNGNQSRDFTYIENVIQANLKACCTPSKYAGQAFNIASGVNETVISMYNILCGALEKDIAPVFQPSRKGDILHSGADISKARKILGYAPKFDFAKGIKLSVQWYKVE